MGNESGDDGKAQRFRDYLGFSESSASGSHRKSQENDIIEGIYSAIKNGRKYYVQIVKSFDLLGLNSALFYIFTNLLEKGVDIKPLEKLDFAQIGIENKTHVVYLISEKYIDTSDPATIQIVSDLISGMVPKELAGTPVLLGLTDETLRMIRKFRGKRKMDDSSKLSNRGKGKNVTLGVGLILLSLTFLITSIATIVDRPTIFFVPIFSASWIIFSLSIIGILGFLFVLFGSITWKTGRTSLVVIAFLMIASFELVSVFIQLSNLSIIKGGGFDLVAPPNTSFVVSNARIVPELYAFLSAFLSIAFFILIYSFSGHSMKIVALIAVVSGIIAEALTVVSFLNISLFQDSILVSYYSKSLFISFYNNISPILPYPGIMLNITGSSSFFGKYSLLIFYLTLGFGFTANLLFFVAFAVTGSRHIKSEEAELSESTMSLNKAT